jgi:hypothetical protein
MAEKGLAAAKEITMKRLLKCLLTGMVGQRPSSGAGPAGRGVRQRGRPSVRPAVELLEDRLVPAVVLNPAPVAVSIPNPPYFTSPFALNGTVLKVTGTSANDTFSFAPKGNNYLVKMNGWSYSVDPAQIHTIVVDCQGQTGDRANLTAGKGPNQLDLSPGGGKLVGADYRVILHNTAIINVAGGSGDSATLTGSTVVPNTFAGTASSSTLSGSGYSITVNGFGSLNVSGQDVYGNGDTNLDVATLTDVDGGATLVATCGLNSVLTYGNGNQIVVTGFQTTNVHAVAGDSAELDANPTLVNASTYQSGVAFAFASAPDSPYSFAITLSGFDGVTFG